MKRPWNLIPAKVSFILDIWRNLECTSRNYTHHSILQRVPMLLFQKKIHASFQQTDVWMCLETFLNDCFLEKGRVFPNAGWQFFRKENITVLAQMPDVPVSIWVEIKLARILKIILEVWRDLIDMGNSPTWLKQRRLWP